MGKTNQASNKEAGKSKDPEILLKSSKQKKARTSAESDGREVLLKVGGFEYKTPTKNTSIHPSVFALPDDHHLSAKKVKEWIKSNREMMSSYRAQMRKEVKGAKARYHDLEGYVRFMNLYLKHGDWISDVYGEHQEKRIKWRTIASPTI